MKRLGRWIRRALGAALALLALLVTLIYTIPLPARLDPDLSIVIEYADGQPAYVFLSADDKWRLEADLARIDPAFVTALVALEDHRFYDHLGFDPIALVRAFGSNLRHGRRVSGGSTLTMQLARLLEPRPRTMGSKLIELFRALQLDARLSKDQILTKYLELAPYGENVEGIEAAAWAYFGHRAAHLTPMEIATLLAVPQGPARLAPDPAHRERLRARRDRILAKLIAAAVFPAAAITEETTLPERLRSFPREASHAAIWLRAGHPDERTIRSTLDRGAQELATTTLAQAEPELARRGIHNGAVVVVDSTRRDVVALAAMGGDIPMFARPRSPGSTLKPFLYAQAIDAGLALPGFLVSDVPAAYGTYRPRNFDGSWNGLVTLEESLARSLNLPFVNLLAQVGVSPFLDELARMGVSAARSQMGPFGLSMIVGAIEVTPLELAGLYATLARNGQYQPLRLTSNDPDGADLSIFGPGAVFLTKRALALRDRPDFPARRRMTGAPAGVHWKTGTSFGFRDAWAVGFDASHTAVVWLGNADNRPSAELVGSDAAGPILFDTLEGLADRTRPAVVPTPPTELIEVEVCAYSGHVASAACPERQRALAPIHAVPTAPCPYHVQHEVDATTGEALTPLCRAGRTTERRSFVVLPSGVARWLADQHRAVPEPPRFAEGCTPASTSRPPAILTPGEGQVVVLIPGVPESKQEIPLQAETRSPLVSWFIDGQLLGTIAANQRLFWSPVPGRHDIVVSDDSGQIARRLLEVKRGR